MEFADLLRDKGIEPQRVLVLRHKPHESKLNKTLPWLVANRLDLFNAFQQSQKPVVEKRITRAEFVASFIRDEPGKARFIGLYAVKGWKRISKRTYWQIPANRELKALGMDGFTKNPPRSSLLWFDLEPVEFHSQLRGQMIIHWPPQDRNWHRFAHKPRNRMPIFSLRDDEEYHGAPAKAPSTVVFVEGSTRQVTLDKCERNPRARQACVAHYGYCCMVCGFDFVKVFGEIGRGFIHVHHLKEFADQDGEREINAITDLRPVCPNCHAMLHAEWPAMSIVKLRRIMQRQQR
jgi:hypothetical protein